MSSDDNFKSSGSPVGINIQLSGDDQNAILKLSEIARDLTGIQLTDRHQSMVASRLAKRVSELGLKSLSDYVAYLHENHIEESPKLVGLLTTHHTYFFREFGHFEYIQNQVLPTLVAAVKARPDKKIKIWAAACSRGQEVYSLAMFLDFHLKRTDPSVSFDILGTDVDPESISIAKNGVYLRNELKEAPLALLGNHWVKGTQEIEAYVKVKKALRDHCRFQTGNLLDLKPGTAPTEAFDLIFCRNVFIYFNPDQIKRISEQLLSRLSPQGYFFIGISESLTGLSLAVDSAGPSVYRPKGAASQATGAKEKDRGVVPSKSISPPVAPAVARALKVLCVDDSPSILTLLKQILNKENGFEIVGTAKNGLEAAQQVRALKPDVMTLDIHMPEQNGLEYLEKNYSSTHPPVVMVTSVSRDNADLAGKALKLGAADYVEKPALTQLAERGEEIRNKLRCAAFFADSSAKRRLDLDRSFQKHSEIKNPEKALRLVCLPLSARAKFKAFIQELGTHHQPPCVILVEGAKDALPHFAEVLSSEASLKINYTADVPSVLKPGEVWLMDHSSAVKSLWESYGKKLKTSILVFGDLSKLGANALLSFQGAQLVLEDLGSGKGSTVLMDVASDVVLATSFAYLSSEFLSADQGSNERKAA